MLRLRPSPEAVSLAREQLERLRDRLTDEAYEDARLMVSELVTNSLRHASLSIDQEIELVMVVRQGPCVSRSATPGRGSSHDPERSMPRTSRGGACSSLLASPTAGGSNAMGCTASGSNSTTCRPRRPTARPGAGFDLKAPG